MLWGSRFTLHRLQEGAPMVLEIVGSGSVEIVEGLLEGRKGGGVALWGTRFATDRMLVVESMVLGVVRSGGSVVVDGFSVLLCAGEGGISVSLFVLHFFQFVFQFFFSLVEFSTNFEPLGTNFSC